MKSQIPASPAGRSNIPPEARLPLRSEASARGGKSQKGVTEEGNSLANELNAVRTLVNFMLKLLKRRSISEAALSFNFPNKLSERHSAMCDCRLKAGPRTLIATSALLLLLFVVVSRVTAQSLVRTITIVPPAVEKNLPPGGSAEGIMKVINDSPETLSFSIGTQDFIVEDTKGTPSLLPENTLSEKYSAASWVAAAPNSFTVPARGQQILNYYIKIPPDARPGGHYTAIIYKPINPMGVKGTGTAVNTNLGTLFYIGVEGDITEKANVVEMKGKRFSEYGPVVLTTTIQNLGDLHIKPFGALTVTDIFGRKVEAQEFPEANIFPGVSRDFENKLGHKFMVGRYKAALLASYGKNNNLPLTAVFYFWVFPWRAFILAVLILLATILSAIYLKKRREPKKPDLPRTPIQSL